MAKNSNLQQAKTAKADEFYTQLSDIEKELCHYKEHFRGKTVLCNCDDPRESNFFRYFALNFEYLGLKRLITTCYKNQEGDLFSDHTADKAVYLIYDGDKNGNHAIDPEELDIRPLQGDGDFRSAECIELLKQADIVVTNPPFSLFREYVAQLMKYEKKFLIIGNVGAASCKEIFPLVMQNKIWFGFHSGHTLFAVPETYSVPDTYDINDKARLSSNGYKFDENGKLWRNLGNICWYTNLDHDKRHEPIILYRRYEEDEYPKYDNYEAIEVKKVEYIPEDYYGIMGVPITFLDKYCPEQFEILGSSQRGCHDLVPDVKKYDDYIEVRQNGSPTGSKGGKTNENCNLEKNDGIHNYFINKDGHIIQSTFGRIFIRRKQ